MKFFWKIFFTTMFISAVCVAASGCILIHSSFRSQLDSEVRSAEDYGDIVYYSLASDLREWEVYSFFIPKGQENHDSEQDEAEWKQQVEQAVVQIAKNMGINGMSQKLTFAIVNENGKTLFSSLPEKLDKSMVQELSSEKKDNASKGAVSSHETNAALEHSASAGWELKKKGDQVWLQTIRPAFYQNCKLYIETVRDVTPIFESQREQCKMLIHIMAGMMLLAGALTLLLSKLLLRPVESLRKTTKVISDGNLSQRAVCRGSDEISLLSENFNQMADHLQEKICQLEEETKKKELFVGAFSHELKTPLTSIIGYADLMRSRDMAQEQRQVCAEYIFSEGQRLSRLSMRLLELIVLKKREFSPTPVSVSRILEQVTEVVGPQLSAAGITLSQSIREAVIPMEEALMKTVFLNLLDNARKAMEAGGQIQICGTGDSRKYVLSIRDQGKGMEQQELKKIREAFYMVDKSRARNQGGAGLGLAICDEILKLHGFTISFESSPGRGTTVTIVMKEAAHEAF